VVDTVEPVKAYLRAFPGLSREGRLKLLGGYLDALRNRGDEHRSEPGMRHPGSNSLFVYRHVFRDQDRGYNFRFLVDDSNAVYGILRVVYCDWRPWE
jgi:hypothetical protein